MRICNSRPARGKPSRYKGVYALKNDRWCAAIRTGNRYHYLGTFDNEDQAARAFDAAALEHRGPGTFLNFRDIHTRIDPVIHGNTALVPLGPGQSFRIDLADLPQVSRYYWNGGPHVQGVNTRQDHTTLHSLLLGHIPASHRVIHVNGDLLDFRRPNLIIAPRTVHQGLARKRSNQTQSIYKGVKRRSANSWHARFLNQYLGSFPTEEAAARAFDDAARNKYGLLAAVNFPRPGERCCLRQPPNPIAA